jgi:hypothetical protein
VGDVGNDLKQGSVEEGGTHIASYLHKHLFIGKYFRVVGFNQKRPKQALNLIEIFGGSTYI